MEGSRTASEIIDQPSTVSPKRTGSAVLALPSEDLVTLRRELLPSHGELQAHIESLTDDPDLGTV